MAAFFKNPAPLVVDNERSNVDQSKSDTPPSSEDDENVTTEPSLNLKDERWKWIEDIKYEYDLSNRGLNDKGQLKPHGAQYM